MGLRVVGAGLGRTGTSSLKAALEKLLGGRCYHMTEVFQHPDHTGLWTAAAHGDVAAAVQATDGYVAAVDWPAAAFWEGLAAANPNAVILLSTRPTPEEWWTSASQTIFVNLAEPAEVWKAERPEQADWRDMWDALAGETFTPNYLDPSAAMARYEEHNAEVRAKADPARLVDWRAADGWAPLCEALDVPVPAEPFPRLNTSDDWLRRRP
jgi:hypothetical protein